MTRGKLILLTILALPFAEIAAFWLVADAIGFFGAFFLLLACSLAGALILASLGRKLLEAVVRNLQDQRIHVSEVRPGTFLTAIGAILLALPGFVTGGIGLVLFLPPVQRRLSRVVFVRGTTVNDGIVNLEDSEWIHVPAERIEKRPEPRGPA